MLLRFWAALTVTLALLACSSGGKDQRNDAAKQQTFPYCTSIPVDARGCEPVVVAAPKATLTLAVATTDAARTRGLMGVIHLPRDQGLLFVFPDHENAQRGFWMKDTVIPLDMVFIATNGLVTEVDENVAASRPGAPERSIARRHGLARYVIELDAFASEAAGIEPGMLLAIPDLNAQ